MFSTLEKILMPVADKLGKNKILVAIRDGFLITTPLIIVGSIFLLIANFPIPGWGEMVAKFLGEGWQTWFTNVSRATFNVIALLSCMGTGYSYARELKGDKIQGAAIALVSFFIVMPTRIPYVGVDGAATISGLGFEYIGSNGLFLALMISLSSVYIFNWVYKKGWTIKMPEGVPPAVCDSFAALIPSAIVMTLFFLVRIGFEFTPYETAHNFIYQVLQTPLQGAGNTLAAQLVYVFACSGFWFFGINGPAVANTVFEPISKILTMENLEAFQAGLPLPNIFTSSFGNFFTNYGGGGSTLSLVIVMLLFCKSKRIKQLGKLAIVPGIFGINEPIIFGLPIVLNPVLIFPFIFVPMMNITLSYFVTKAGIIPYTTGVALPWTTPIGISGYLATGSIIASGWQFLLLFTGCLIYFPFIKMLDKQYLQEEDNAKNNNSGELSFDEVALEDISLDDISLDDIEL
ncbi:PTS sugar transporter subunit IIC [Clostridium disporicum]|uniref:Permease IIC component n=1 Tax=Clostridium disporicum TaxID=84024 RepID=A0A174C7G1_9CLOT|nr:PTS sugar transporter subunit IIC [Clostridium disporicum]MDY3360073.1 PTS sugar transporter subunit IIC [Clostridium celatum]CUO07825.1 PTS system cellobiose-specific transporter subunit IIC [Clostridium disporicum]